MFIKASAKINNKPKYKYKAKKYQSYFSTVEIGKAWNCFYIHIFIRKCSALGKDRKCLRPFAGIAPFHSSWVRGLLPGTVPFHSSLVNMNCRTGDFPTWGWLQKPAACHQRQWTWAGVEQDPLVFPANCDELCRKWTVQAHSFVSLRWGPWLGQVVPQLKVTSPFLI